MQERLQKPQSSLPPEPSRAAVEPESGLPLPAHPLLPTTSVQQEVNFGFYPLNQIHQGIALPHSPPPAPGRQQHPLPGPPAESGLPGQVGPARPKAPSPNPPAPGAHPRPTEPQRSNPTDAGPNPTPPHDDPANHTATATT